MEGADEESPCNSNASFMIWISHEPAANRGSFVFGQKNINHQTKLNASVAGRSGDAAL